MDHSVHNRIVSFIWSIADDCLRDVYVRGKYRDVILPMFVLRRLDCLLEPTKEAVEEEVRFQREEAGLTDLDPTGLREASGYIFYNTSPWTLQRLVDTATNTASILEQNFNAYLNGFSSDVVEIIERFKLREQVKHMSEKDVLLDVLEKFTNKHINLTPNEVLDPDGRKMPPLTNLGMGYVFEELIRKFNEENNEEAGEHFTPREVIDLMTHLVFEPVNGNLPSVITIYDPACGSGGMLTESQNFVIDPNGRLKSNVEIYLYGKEINDETYAICKSDMMIKGNNPENIKVGSTLATDDFSSLRFDFMLSNPPYGKSWVSDQKIIMDGKQVLDPRFEVELADFRGNKKKVPAIPRSSDGQLLFLMEMVSKMKSLDKSPLGSRIASVHNGSSLFTGDAGGGESNIRRHIIENDLLEAIIQLPNNLFYNTGITTYIWLLSNNKAEHRKGKVQLIDASGLFRKLRKNLGQKNCEFAPEHIEAITRTCIDFVAAGKQSEDDIASKLFDNNDFGYYKVTIERPSRRTAQFTEEKIAGLRLDNKLKEPMQWAYEQYGDDVYTSLNDKKSEIEKWLEDEEINLNSKQQKALFNTESWKRQKRLFEVAQKLMAAIGRDEFKDYNLFREKVVTWLKENKVKSPSKPDKPIQSTEVNQILNSVSWYDETAEKVIAKRNKLKGDKLEKLLQELGCPQDQMQDYGYWPSDVDGEWIEYETETGLRDFENIPLKENIHDYFIREVRPHVDEAWINIDQTKIGYEISFNKYFYQHKPLRSLEDVTADILKLEAETEGLLKKLVSFTAE